MGSVLAQRLPTIGARHAIWAPLPDKPCTFLQISADRSISAPELSGGPLQNSGAERNGRLVLGGLPRHSVAGVADDLIALRIGRAAGGIWRYDAAG